VTNQVRVVSNRGLSYPAPARWAVLPLRFDPASTFIFTDGSPRQSTALTKTCRDLALIARGGFMLRCRNGFAALRHICCGC
jgi:hypothetical protein